MDHPEHPRRPSFFGNFSVLEGEEYEGVLYTRGRARQVKKEVL